MLPVPGLPELDGTREPYYDIYHLVVPVPGYRSRTLYPAGTRDKITVNNLIIRVGIRYGIGYPPGNKIPTKY